MLDNVSVEIIHMIHCYKMGSKQKGLLDKTVKKLINDGRNHIKTYQIGLKSQKKLGTLICLEIFKILFVTLILLIMLKLFSSSRSIKYGE